jgi:hypothetical protein
MTFNATLVDEVLVASTFDESMIDAQKVNNTKCKQKKAPKQQQSSE